LQDKSWQCKKVAEKGRYCERKDREKKQKREREKINELQKNQTRACTVNVLREEKGSIETLNQGGKKYIELKSRAG